MALELKRFKCTGTDECKHVRSCTHLPVEVHADNGVDILFVTEFPGKSEAEENTPFVGRSMNPARRIIQILSEKYNFSYAFTSLHKSRKDRDASDINRPFSRSSISYCAQHCFAREVKALKPKFIFGFGVMAEEYLSGTQIESIFVEGGCIRTSIPIAGKKYEYMTSIHPAWAVNQQFDANAIGFIYEDIQKAALYIKQGIDLRIPDSFKSETLTTLKSVREVLRMIKSQSRFCAVDTETRNLNRAYDNSILSIQLCNDGKTGYVIPLFHFDSPFVGKDLEKVKSEFCDFFTGETKVKGYTFVNAKFDYHQFIRDLHTFQWNSPIIDCSYVEFWFEESWARLTKGKLFPKGKGPYSLYTMSLKRGFTYYKVSGEKERRDILEKLPLKEWEGYAGADAVATYNVFKSQIKLAKALGITQQFKKACIHLYNHMVRTMTYTEHCGMATSPYVLRDLYNPRTSVLLKAMDGIVDEMNRMPSVQTLNRTLQRSKIGIYTNFLGTTKSFQPTKRLQLEALFFDILKLEPVGEKLSVNKQFQKQYKDSVKEVALLAEYNEISTLQKMFVNPIYEMMTKGTQSSTPDFYTDNRIRPTFRYDAVTSRLRCEKPNLQQRPSRGSRIAPILSMYDCKPGRAIVKCDYSTFEVRGLGFLSGDRNMIKLFSEMHKVKQQYRENPLVFAEEGYKQEKMKLEQSLNELRESKKTIDLLKDKDYKVAIKQYKSDLSEIKSNLEKLEKRYEEDPVSFSMEVRTWKTDFHRRSAALFNGIAVQDVSKAMRQGAKGFVFGVMYGRGEMSIARELNVSEQEAIDLKEKFQSNMSEAWRWLEASAEQGREEFYVESPLGNIRHLWGHLLDDRAASAKMDRLAQNSVNQGACSNMNLVAGSNLIDYFYRCGKGKYQVPDDKAWFLTNIVHDSCEMEVPIEDVYFCCKAFEYYFTEGLEKTIEEEFGFKIKVPLEVDFTVAPTYANTRDWDGSDRHLKELQKWIIEECGKRDNTDYSHLYKVALKQKYVPR